MVSSLITAKEALKRKLPGVKGAGLRGAKIRTVTGKWRKISKNAVIYARRRGVWSVYGGTGKKSLDYRRRGHKISKKKRDRWGHTGDTYRRV